MEYQSNIVPEEDCDEVFNHRVFGMHIKQENNALSEENPHVCIGWSDLGDLSEVSSKEELATLLTYWSIEASEYGFPASESPSGFTWHDIQ